MWVSFYLQMFPNGTRLPVSLVAKSFPIIRPGCTAQLSPNTWGLKIALAILYPELGNGEQMTLGLDYVDVNIQFPRVLHLKLPSHDTLQASYLKQTLEGSLVPCWWAVDGWQQTDLQAHA